MGDAMNSEEDEFKRIEAEAKRRVQNDDDTQGYVTENFLQDYQAGAAAEREACAKLCEAGINADKYPSLTDCAAAIRARGQA